MKTGIRMLLSFVCATACHISAATDANGADRYTVHEWGTFTVLQDETGQPLPGVNVNEESLPPFVHRLSHQLLPDGGELAPFRGWFSKGIPASYPAALMRMETPIIYIYPPDTPSAEQIDVGVRFHGGWISEHYPNALVEAPGFDGDHKSLGSLTPRTVGSIQWNHLTVGGDKNPPATDRHVWLAPRDVAAPMLSTPEGQCERYLFYRGVANIEAPLCVVRNAENNSLAIHANLGQRNLVQRPMRYGAVWLADIRDGTVAFRELSSLVYRGGNTLLATIPATFEPGDYTTHHMAHLRKSMKAALLEEGLFDDEAEAMLNTWKLSYFQSDGLRLFFTLPREWTDQVLPLTVSQKSDIVRAMIGRIEIVTPDQRRLLRKLSNCQVSDGSWLKRGLEKFAVPERYEVQSAIYSGRRSLDHFQIQVPEDYQTFLQLGRFRDALVLDELKRHPTENLRKFVGNYQLCFQASQAVSIRSVDPAAGE